MTASVLKIIAHTDLPDGLPNLAAYRDRFPERPAYGSQPSRTSARISPGTPRPT